MSTGADAPFHPDHLYQAPYDAAAHKRIAALVVEKDRLITDLAAALGALEKQFVKWPDGLIVPDSEPRHVQGCRRLMDTLMRAEASPCSERCEAARAVLEPQE